jgi:eukaryotic-like serine/threonine-protein kinase
MKESRIVAHDRQGVKSIFDEAAEIASPEARAAYLESACGGDANLRKLVDGLLVALDEAGGFLEPAPDGTSAGLGSADVDSSAATEPPPIPPLAEGPGTMIGPYKLVQLIGEGGMGAVFMAVQEKPVRRKVALKIIKPGMDTRQVVARFEAERQALAMMDHPNIARVLDGGATESGRPFFVMELVKGTPITTFCDERRLTPRQRLELFVPVCQAIQHAHQKGIIHRDIKPSNVLIALYDDRPVPKVIDFGIAKATGPQLTEHSLMTDFGAVIGTPEYMSPEQASLNNLDIDTRSDVYALGVLLYELLTGTTPVDRRSLGRAAVLEVLRIVREVEPPRPSTRLSTLDILPSIAANRGTEPARLAGILRGELDWIVMKALEKDRARRYETANALVRDVQRHLADEVVEARPPSAGYRLRKIARRHRGRVIAASLVLLALVAGIIGTSWGLVRARTANAQAQRRLEQIEKGNEILTGVFADLDIDQVKQGNKPLEAVLADRLVKAVSQLDEKSVGDPLVVAMLQSQLGTSLRSLGFAAEAIPPLEKALATRRAGLGADHPQTLETMTQLAGAYAFASRLKEAVPLAEEHLQLTKARYKTGNKETIESMGNLGLYYRAMGRQDEAMSVLEEAVNLAKSALEPSSPITIVVMSNLALVYKYAGREGDALPLYEEALRLAKTVYGPDHVNTIGLMSGLAFVYLESGRVNEAVALAEEAYRLAKASLGPNHPTALVSSAHLANCYDFAGRFEEALPLLEEQYRIAKVQLGLDHRHTLIYMSNLAQGLLEVGRLDEALRLAEESLQLTRAKLGPDYPDTLIVAFSLAQIAREAGRPDRSVPLLEETLRLREQKLGRTNTDTLRTLAELGLNDKDAGRLDQALKRLEEAYKQRSKIPASTRLWVELFDAYALAGRMAEADAVAAELLAETRTEMAKGRWKGLTQVLDKTGEMRLRAGAFAAAEPLLRECLAVRAKVQPGDWRTFYTRTLLGGSLLGQKKYAEAEPMLRQGYEEMKAREKTIAPIDRHRLAAAVDRLIALYTATNKPEELKRWRAERARYVKSLVGGEGTSPGR